MRFFHDNFLNQLAKSKLVLLEGPKKSGKATFIRAVCNSSNLSVTFLDSEKIREHVLDEVNQLRSSGTQIIVFEQAEFIPNLDDLIEELLQGNLPQRIVLSCSFTPKLNEEFRIALRHEGMAFYYYPEVFVERAATNGLSMETEQLETHLVYGVYPQVVSNNAFAELKLRELIDEVIATHLGSSDRINKGVQMLRLLQHLAFEIGEPISYHELGKRCKLDNETVERYIDLFVNAHLLIRLPSLSNEKRYEMRKSNSFYFIDNGIRNALINNFNPPFLRNDMEMLWRNYLIAERIKLVRMLGLDHGFSFWRSHTGQQIDLIEHDEEGAHGYKTDWEKRKKIRIPPLFTNYYPDLKVSVLNKNTSITFLGKRS